MEPRPEGRGNDEPCDDQALKVELVWTRDWQGLEELRDAVEHWLRIYNEVRPHEALGWMTPAEKRAQNLGIEVNLAA